MGEPIKIRYLAEQMIRLAGKEPGKDIRIVYTGMRPGEKLNEELFHEKERLTGTSHNKILLSSSREFDWEALNVLLDEMAEACGAYDEERLLQLLCTLVPEFDVQAASPSPSPARVITLGSGRQPADA
ncbi:MAG TPA: polysaccharide biosynthesis protein, partial [Chromatiales bacterium]|nr:polysaccharide biosynthesis protein [Chromatiales bacterium]